MFTPPYSHSYDFLYLLMFSLDLVFSNWLFMYLTDKQVLTMLQRILGWLKPGGHLFFRESCFNQSGRS